MVWPAGVRPWPRSTQVTGLMPKIVDMTGQRFGRWTILERALNKREGIQAAWFCRCDCGVGRVVPGARLRSGQSRSCGCLRDELAASRGTTHGWSASSVYVCWTLLIQRCTNPNNTLWHRYGGRGIECRFTSFEQFRVELGPRPSPRHTCDRIDNEGHYEPGNVQWSTQKEQARNRSSNRLITWRGKTQCLAAWADELSIPYKTLHARLSHGWSVEKALTTPKGHRSK